MKLTTLEKFKTLSPWRQGYVIYMEAEQPGSELKTHQSCPYDAWTKERAAWEDGQAQAVQHAQDSEE